jgi:hypothetical protein
MRSYLEKNPRQKRAGGVAYGVGPEFKTQYQKKKATLLPKALGEEGGILPCLFQLLVAPGIPWIVVTCL